MRRFLGWIILSTAPWAIPIIEQVKAKVRLELDWVVTREILKARRREVEWSYLYREEETQNGQ